jgi:hypothetical protein
MFVILLCEANLQENKGYYGWSVVMLGISLFSILYALSKFSKEIFGITLNIAVTAFWLYMTVISTTFLFFIAPGESVAYKNQTF